MPDSNYTNTAPSDNKITATLDATVKQASAMISKKSFKQKLIDITEIVVSKVGPAGMGWQGASVLAGLFGFASTSAQFALTTGLGEGLAVFLGHVIYFAVKKKVKDRKIKMTEQIWIGLWLGTAAFTSGTFWQPILSASLSMGFGFYAAASITGLGCGLMFLAGLRLGRQFYSHIEKPNAKNLKDDALLSLAISGAAGSFVGTSNLLGNPLQWFVVQNSDTVLKGVLRAGASTAFGFFIIGTIRDTVIEIMRLAKAFARRNSPAREDSA